MKIGAQEFDTKNRTYIMGILNVTPDSFSDGGQHSSLDEALFFAEDMVKAGAHILDVGGESTRPGHVQISGEEEIARTAPVIERISREFEVPVSVDTYKAKVAKAAVEAGADLVNDIWGLKYDEKMAAVIAEAGVACCLMHNRDNMVYNDFVNELKQDLIVSLDMAQKAGISTDRIILDPGVGFAKTYEQNLKIIHELSQLHELGCPLLLGTSRKSVIGLTLNLPVSQRLEGTLVTTVMAVMERCAFIRVHDIEENKRAVRMAEAIRDCLKKA